MKKAPAPIHRPLPTREQIAERAEELFHQRGRQPGHELDDWLQAEYELMQLPVHQLAELATATPSRRSTRQFAVVCLVQAALLIGTKGLPPFRA